MSRRTSISLILAVCVGLLLLIFSFCFHQSVVVSGRRVVVIIEAGRSLGHVAEVLAAQTNIKHAYYWKWMARLLGVEKRLHAGEFALTPGMTTVGVLRRLSSNQVVYHAVTLVPGKTFHDIRAQLTALPNIAHVLRGKSGLALVRALHLPAHHPEGYFFPDTYKYTVNDTDVSLLKRAHKRMQMILQQLWQTRAQGLWYKHPYQALIVASLIEKETADEREKPLIASVIMNRLHRWIPLQIDPTVVYAMGKPYGYRLSKHDLKFRSLYNTYLHYGLPPTPICLPSRSSLYAALHPAQSRYLYYVVQSDGKHAFAASYRQQRQHIHPVQAPKNK